MSASCTSSRSACSWVAEKLFMPVVPAREMTKTGYVGELATSLPTPVARDDDRGAVKVL